MPYWSVLLIDV